MVSLKEVCSSNSSTSSFQNLVEKSVLDANGESTLPRWGYREPLIWTDVLQGAAQLLEEGGILLMYDTETWCSFFMSSTTLHRSGARSNATPLWGPVWQFGSMHDRPPKGAFGCPSEPWTCFGTGNEWLQHDWNVEQLE